MNNKIGLSFDVDWQDGPILTEVINLLNRYRIKATFFCTHKTKIVIPACHEFALHPNFHKKIDYRRNIALLQKIYPRAKGIRSHALESNYNIMEAIFLQKLAYKSNELCYLKPGITASKFIGVTELPIYYMDYHHLATNRKPKFGLDFLDLKSPGLKIFDIHPLNVFLNSYDFSLYKKCKENGFKNPERFINRTRPGIKNLLINLLKHLDNIDQRDARIMNIYRENKCV